MSSAYDYILYELKNSKTATSAIHKKLKKLEKKNRNLTFLTLSLTAYAIITAINYSDIYRKIDILNDEILELRLEEKGV